MKVKKALEAYYRRLKPPEGVESDVLYRIEKERSRRWRAVALTQFALFLLLAVALTYLYLFPTEYETMGTEEAVRVKLIKEVDFNKLARELSEHSLKIEGPYDKNEFYLKGERNSLKRFLSKTDIFKRSD